MTRPLILGFDTSAAHCAAALVRGDQTLVARGEPMAKGQAERLMDLLQEVLAAEGVTWQDLSALAVGIGPGNFTGIRIGVSAARGLALGLGIPAYGVTGFEARQRLAPEGTAVAVPAPRAMAYVVAGATAQIVPLASIAAPAPEPEPAALAQAIAAHASTVWPAQVAAPAPYYVRPPDAAPARDAAPTLLP
ncbi:tRNA (adenosine(37)-N6)-threonylcarbamoyltransferase complex dimerization subunit type 1 TsaB [uncultured Tateyamaria sp.]|uniref:tRNA (adenosine(37)-N6)-threonylcarbamoyltransferase complex dimerization subunit type 1 TsaB n=1 Tax=uncultured Tateyamaria sp. TaxID=455651 RepID=UPI002607F7EC|nr:tRNA (adenosine(37)-N6)-threonylcarbamoyltransferase complex dimerization subunit type 1 TsaB [uncultured Tateyamaria sp.]